MVYNVKSLRKDKMDAQKLGKKIKIARVELDLSQTDLAKKIGTNQKSISRYENGDAFPSVPTLAKIVKALKKPAGHFLDE